jgi:hypothetical protein
MADKKKATKADGEIAALEQIAAIPALPHHTLSSQAHRSRGSS